MFAILCQFFSQEGYPELTLDEFEKIKWNCSRFPRPLEVCDVFCLISNSLVENVLNSYI